jgi:signal transduction histidine kinase
MQFRTKARAVDLLGKGQIADLPTAITELWKNGYDAYADNLTAEIFLSGYKGLTTPLFVISDDGTGMKQSDILDKWLVLGVDSKSRSSQADIEGEDTLWKKPRIKAGEKGIGRLSVAFLGSPMLMLTKKQGYPLQAMYFDWRVLENYNMFLDDVEIPVESTDIPSFRHTFEILKKSFLKNVNDPGKYNSEEKVLWESDQDSLRNTIIKSTENIIIPDFFEQEILNSFVKTDSHGTKFIIFEPEEQIVNLVIDAEKEDDLSNDNKFTRSSLVGFTNLFKPESERLPIKTKFPMHIDSDEPVGIDFFRGSGQFFDEKDYDIADIVIEGKWDGNGSFDGQLKFSSQLINYSFYNSTRRRDSRSNYGEYSIKLGYSMGREEDSFLKGEAWHKIDKKVKQYGGLYIYRDGFRVLPYGRSDADFLELEERRSKRFGSFFSYRRLFGYIELSRKGNSSLKDKSSREGLINNASYRAFKDDLIAMFIDLANEYFGDKAKQSVFLDEKKKNKEQSDAIKKDKEREKQEIAAFTRSLKEYPKRFEEYQLNYEQTINELQEKLLQSNMVFADIESLLNRIQKLDIQYSDLLPKIPKRYKLKGPQEKRLDEYAKQLELFRETINAKGSSIVQEARARLQIQDLRKDFSNRCNTYIANLEETVEKLKKRFLNRTDQLSCDIEERASSFLIELKAQKEKSLNTVFSQNDIEREIDTINSLFNTLQSSITDSIEPLVAHIERISLDIDEELLQGAYKEQYERIKEQWQLSKETSQLGIAVEIIDHEFNSLYTQINSTLDLMSKHNDTSDFAYLKKSFKTLEDKYALLSPLYRISGSIAKDISGTELLSFLKSFFENRLLTTNVDIRATKDFENHIIHIKEPVIYSVMINIVNNALYWMKNSENKIVEFAYYPNTEEIIIRNSGLPIKDNKLQKIFELFYTNRPNGRGLGLYLAKESLNDCYFDIYATNDKAYNTLSGACFVIKPLT